MVRGVPEDALSQQHNFRVWGKCPNSCFSEEGTACQISTWKIDTQGHRSLGKCRVRPQRDVTMYPSARWEHRAADISWDVE